MYERENALKEWLGRTLPQKEFTLTALTGDASFRRYFRIQFNELTQIVMDAPPEKEALKPFIHIAKTLANAQVLTPEIHAVNQQQGFLLLSDFGDQLLLSQLRENTAEHYYHSAIQTLFKIQTCSIANPQLASFDHAFMRQEMQLCNDWFFDAYLGLHRSENDVLMIHNTMEWLASDIAQQPLTFIHRDYHSRNLMLVAGQAEFELGVIDFQDAMRGPLTYDLVSLLKDCYISWPRSKTLEWVRYFYDHSELAQTHYTFAEFVRAFDLCGVQRHIKVLGVFSRLYLRDGKAGYLGNLPLTLNYVLECAEIYKELHPLFNFLQKNVVLP